MYEKYKRNLNDAFLLSDDTLIKAYPVVETLNGINVERVLENS